jgi:hypothetical protein
MTYLALSFLISAMTPVSLFRYLDHNLPSIDEAPYYADDHPPQTDTNHCPSHTLSVLKGQVRFDRAARQAE